MSNFTCHPNCVNLGCNPPDWLEKHNAFLLSLIGVSSGVLGLFLNHILKSRCKKISCLGMSCDRDVIPLKIEDIDVVPKKDDEENQ